MYEWLDNELKTIHTRKFHLIKRNVKVSFAERFQKQIDWPCDPPPSFKSFVGKYGCAFLYRSHTDSYYIRVFPLPIHRADKNGESFLEFGGSSGVACYKSSSLKAGREAPIYEQRGNSGLFKTYDSFSDWIDAASRYAHRQYTHKEWQSILKGPPPFTAKEKQIVLARSKFQWCVVGVAPNGDLRFKVTNSSKRVLPFLTIGIEGPNLIGGVWLPVSNVLPGETKIIEKAAYKDLVDPNKIVAFSEPAPLPEDRDRYWEFHK